MHINNSLVHTADSLGNTKNAHTSERVTIVSPTSHPFLFNPDGAKKNIGVWGYGVVGKSVVRFLLSHGFLVAVMDRRTLPTELVCAGVRGFAETEEGAFFEWCEVIIPSPGVHIETQRERYPGKWLAEVDLFAHSMPQKTIGITGSVGKTTITHVLSELLIRYGENIGAGGNIGFPLLDLACEKRDAHTYVIELSSFQLAFAQTFAPDLALITNIVPNHLDWHGTFDKYQEAKLNLIALQKEGQKALVPLALREHIRALSPRSTIAWFRTSAPTAEESATLHPTESIYYISDDRIMRHDNTSTVFILDLTTLPPLTFPENWLTLTAILDMQQYDLQKLPTYAQEATVPQHRVEKIPYKDASITIYNDSKSTTIQSTQAALGLMAIDRPIRLVIGGLGKGVDRAPLIAQLPQNVVKTYCFGGEKENLATHCVTYQKTHHVSTTLEEAVAQCLNESNPGDQILFSPAGTSYDLFTDYQHRGNRFKELVSSWE